MAAVENPDDAAEENGDVGPCVCHARLGTAGKPTSEPFVALSCIYSNASNQNARIFDTYLGTKITREAMEIQQATMYQLHDRQLLKRKQSKK